MFSRISTLIFLLVIALILASPVLTFAQILPPPPPQPAAAPLDPLSWLLLGAGGAVAGKQYYDYRKNKGRKS